MGVRVNIGCSSPRRRNDCAGAVVYEVLPTPPHREEERGAGVPMGPPWAVGDVLLFGSYATFRAHAKDSPNGTSEVPFTAQAFLIAAAARNRSPRTFMSAWACISRSATRPVVNLPERGGVMDYKALVKTVRDAGDVSAMVDHETLRDSNERKIELPGSEECLTWGMVIALCDAVEALEKDRERMNVAERLLGEPTQRAQQFRDGLIALVHDGATVITLRDLIDAASSPTPTASTPTPAVPSDA